MFNLPAQTQVNQIIPKNKFIENSSSSSAYLKAVLSEDIDSIIWRNKISESTYPVLPGKRFPEFQIIEVISNQGKFDKRALRIIDKSIPYYVLYMQSFQGNYQAWIGDKSISRSSVRVDNYIHSRWIVESDLSFFVPVKTVDDIYESCKTQIALKSRVLQSGLSSLSGDAFLDYCDSMLMTYSYKPLLIIALMRHGGEISVSKAANFFSRYYTARKAKGLFVEKPGCIFAVANAPQNELETCIINNPVNALMNSGFFNYDRENRLFSIKEEVYDSLSLAQIDSIEKTCIIRLKMYFQRYKG